MNTNKYLTKGLACIGFSLLTLSVLAHFQIKIDWQVATGIPVIIPQLIEWVDTLIHKKTHSIIELDKKYQQKDNEQDALLRQAMNIASKAEVAISQVTKYHELCNSIAKTNENIISLKNSLKIMGAELSKLRENQESF